jgi:hypothetical protein
MPDWACSRDRDQRVRLTARPDNARLQPMRSLLASLLCIVLAIPAVHGGSKALAPIAGVQVTATDCCSDDAGSCSDTADCDLGQACAVRCAVPTVPAVLPAGTAVIDVAGTVRAEPFAVAEAPPDAATSPPLRPPRFPTHF